MERPSIALRLTVFENENPSLYRLLSALPEGRFARRTVLMRLLELGARVDNGEIAAGGPARPISLAAVGREASSSPATAVATPSALPDVQIDQADLAEVFGK